MIIRAPIPIDARRLLGGIPALWLISRPELSPGAKLTYWALAQYCDENGRAQARHAALVEVTGIPHRSVRRYLDELSECKLLLRMPQFDGNGDQIENQYLFVLHEWLKEVLLNTEVATPHGQIGHPPVQSGQPNIKNPNRGSKSEEDLKEDPDLPTVSVTPTSRAPQKRPPRIRGQMPDDFKLNQHDRELAKLKGMSDPHGIDHQFETFCSYHRAKGNTMKDWHGAWRTWCLNYRSYSHFGDNRTTALFKRGDVPLPPHVKDRR